VVSDLFVWLAAGCGFGWTVWAESRNGHSPTVK